MEYPSDEVMDALHALTRSVGITIDDGKIEVGVPDLVNPDGTGGLYELTGAVLDELFRRGWVQAVGQDDIEVSDQGVYWCRRWCQLRDKANRNRPRTGRLVLRRRRAG